LRDIVESKQPLLAHDLPLNKTKCWNFLINWARKSPLIMLRLRELTLAHSRIAAAQGAAMASRLGIFPYIYKGWSGPKLSLT
jgi:hypothetical protein